MKIRQDFYRGLLTIFIVIMSLVPPGAKLSYGAAGVSPFTPPQNDFLTPPNFGAYAGVLNADFDQCFRHKALSALGGLAGSSARGVCTDSFWEQGLKLTTKCPEAPTISLDRTDMDCKDISTRKGTVTKSKINALLKDIEKSACAHECSQAKLSYVGSELKCIENQISILNGQIDSLQSFYDQQREQMEERMEIMNDYINGRNVQMAEVQSHLNGQVGPDGKILPGSKGLLAVKDELDALIREMPAQIQQVKAAHEDAKRAKRIYNRARYEAKVKYARACFAEEVDSRFQCEPDGPPVSFQEHLLCRFRQEIELNRNGAIDTKMEVTSRAEEAKLKSLVDKVFNMSISGNTDLESYENWDFTMEKIEARFAVELGNFDKMVVERTGRSLGIQGKVLGKLKSCVDRAHVKLETDQNIAGSLSPNGQAQPTIAEYQMQLRNTEQQVRTLTNTNLLRYSKIYRDTTKVLTNRHIPLLIDSCQRGTLEVQVECLEEAQGKMENLLAGTGDPAFSQVPVSFSFPSGNPQMSQQLSINTTCQGLNGCVTLLESFRDSMIKEVKRVEKMNGDYVIASNRALQSFTNQFKNQMSGPNGILVNQLEGLNQTLAELGVDPVSIKYVQGMASQANESEGEDGKKQIAFPQDVRSLIGNQMKPPMVDLAGSDIAGTLKNINNASASEREKVAETIALDHQLKNLAQTCTEESLEKTIAEIEAKMGVWRGSCGGKLPDCDSSRSQLESALSDLKDVLGDRDLDPSNLSNLETGITDFCAENGVSAANIEKLIEERNRLQTLAATSNLDPAVARHYMQQQEALNRQIASLSGAAGSVSCRSVSGIENDIKRLEGQAKKAPKADSAI